MRRMRITKEDVRRVGMAPGCPGCIGINRGLSRDHSELCRTRIETELMARGDLRPARAGERMKDWREKKNAGQGGGGENSGQHVEEGGKRMSRWTRKPRMARN